MPRKKVPEWRKYITNKSIADVLIASMNTQQKKMVKIMELLKENPRISLGEISCKTGIPTATSHGIIRKIGMFFKQVVDFEVKSKEEKWNKKKQ